MKKFFYYIRKYVENFGFVNRVVWLTLWYSLLVIFISNRRLIKVINKRKNNNDKDSFISESDIIKINYLDRTVDKLIYISPFKISKGCLVRTLVKKSIIKSKFDYDMSMNFFIKFKKNLLFAHVQLSVNKANGSFKYLGSII